MSYHTDWLLMSYYKTALEVTDSDENSNTMHPIQYFENSAAANMIKY